MVRRGPDGVTVGRPLPASRLTQPRPRRPPRLCQKGAQELSPRHLAADGALRWATWGPGPPQVSAHSPRQRAVGSGWPEHPVQVPKRQESARRRGLGPTCRPRAGRVTHRRPAQGANPNRGPHPPAMRAPVRRPPSQGAARPEDVAHESRVEEDGSPLLQLIFGRQSPSFFG
ncbi:hypothetical protein NDU88_002458 [Pleurodeles waltl]|uniref:Uncharacterized protein n=1 Tax=Pleurodeles waltl TaxID=8319 RepID=A0AAV7WQB6_PLEWA|nr:hypothetical protein NDU88_002458 [Pleurodeles waltl]